MDFNEKRINRSNKIYPIFYGLSSDLIFFIAINTLFLTTVKGLTSFEINFIATVGVLVALVFYLFSHKIIRKMGNLSSIRLGTFLMFISAILFTFSTHVVFFALAEILYEVSFVFKCVEQAVLSNNLVYQNKEDDFIKTKTKAAMIYSIATLIATLLGGYLFTIHPYIPMLLCIIICFINFIMSFYIYEVQINHHLETKKASKLNFNKILFLTILIYGIIYGTISVCQTNDELFIQYELQSFLNGSQVAFIMPIILFLSRLSRLLSNIVFGKLYDKLKNKTLYIIYFSLFFSVFLFVVGNMLFLPQYSSILMALGFILLLALRDPTENLLSNILLQNTKKEEKEKVLLYFQFMRRLVVFILCFLSTMILATYELIHLYIVFVVFIFFYLFIILKLFSLLNHRDK